MAARDVAETDDPANCWRGRGIQLRGRSTTPLYIYKTKRPPPFRWG